MNFIARKSKSPKKRKIRIKKPEIVEDMHPKVKIRHLVNYQNL